MTTDQVKALLRPCIAALEPYSTARDEFDGTVKVDAWLDANESPFPNGVNRYPDPHHKELKACISELKGIDHASLFLGNGSDEAIDLMYRLFCTPGVSNAVAIAPTYGMYSVAAAINDVAYTPVELGADFSLPADALLNACDADTRLMWICSPNNPTANAFPLDELEAIADRFNGILIVDEAYVDFSSAGSITGRLNNHPNIVVLQTLSKARGMAGLRIGMAIAHPLIIEAMNRVKYPYNINILSQRKALELLTEPGFHEHLDTLIEGRQWLAEALAEAPAVKKVYPSDANFLLVQFDDADVWYDRLLAGGVLVRHRGNMPGCSGCLRITVGTPEENKRIADIVNQY